MRKLFITSILLIALLGVAQAQNFDNILRDIEVNNASLRAQKSLGKAQRLNLRAGNMPDGPEAEYMHSWDRNSSATVSEINVTQGFDFPTAYIARRKAVLAQEEQLGHELNTFRQDILLEAKLLCIDIVALRQEYHLLEMRTANTRRMASALQKAMDKGEISTLEKNRGDIELANMQNQLGLKKIELESALERLQNLNGGKPVVLTDTLFSLPEEVLPFEVMKQEYECRAPQLLSIMAEKKSAEAGLKASRSSALPGITVGYHHEINGEEKLNGIIVGISLPLWKSRREIKQAKAQIEYADARLESERVDRLSTLKELYGRYNTLKTTFEALVRIDLEQEPALHHITEAYHAGILNETDFLSEVNALYEVKGQRIAIERDLHKVVAQINALNL